MSVPRPKDILLRLGGAEFARTGSLWRRRRFDPNEYEGYVFTRADGSTVAGLRDKGGSLRTAAANKLRPYYANDLPGILLEPSRVQICPNPQAPNSWTDVGTPVVTTGQTDPWGGTAAILMEDNDAAVTEGKEIVVAFTADATKCAMFAVRAGSAAVVRCVVQDATAVATRHSVSVTWNGGTIAPTIATVLGSGTIYAPEAIYDSAGNLWWLIAFSATGVVAANSNQLRLLIGTAVTGTGTVYFAGANAWNATLPTSWIGAAATTRAVDNLSLPIGFPGQLMTIYTKFTERGAILNTSSRLWHIGASDDSDPRLLVGEASGFYRVFHDAGATAVTSTQAAAPVYGDLVELRAVLYADGSVKLGQSINGAAETVAAQSAANTIANWSANKLWIGSRDGSNVGATVLHDLIFARGAEYTMAEMRSAAA